ncbi:hypothetical protein [Paenibacillus hexagrammi]|uniref:Uncharacterized protein n=1 Tax=Paenibacillus hexagrammi TaxID=2908839 RepID=A0ABY3SRD4_9BACL|nr:hypothetical protein [Paenibacillus sp. YPD9-1]UJF35970.1 hypothetical protein L0M14_13320 [Paenibacillus sp. YPD9-1]
MEFTSHDIAIIESALRSAIKHDSGNPARLEIIKKCCSSFKRARSKRWFSIRRQPRQVMTESDMTMMIHLTSCRNIPFTNDSRQTG